MRFVDGSQHAIASAVKKGNRRGRMVHVSEFAVIEQADGCDRVHSVDIIIESVPPLVGGWIYFPVVEADDTANKNNGE